MKAQVLVIAGALLAALPAPGLSQSVQKADASSYQRASTHSTPYLEKAARNLEVCLKSDNEGVVETAVAYASFLRVAAPDLDLCFLRAELEEIAASGRTPGIRYRAFLATMVYENPRDFEGSLSVEGTDGDQFFASVADQTSKRLLGYRSK